MNRFLFQHMNGISTVCSLGKCIYNILYVQSLNEDSFSLLHWTNTIKTELYHDDVDYIQEGYKAH